MYPIVARLQSYVDVLSTLFVSFFVVLILSICIW